MRTPNGVWAVYRARQAVGNPGEGGVIASPHRQREAQCLLQPLESFANGGERQAHRGRLPLVVSGSDPEPGPPAGEHVEGGDGLDQ